MSDTQVQDYSRFDDAGYVHRALTGDRTAFDALVRQYTSMVYAIGFARLNGDREGAEELCQEVFLRAWLHLSTLSRPDYFPAWIARIARNLASDWHRSNSRTSALVQMIPMNDPETMKMFAQTDSPRDAASRQEETNLLTAALARMTADRRELLLLHYAEGLSFSEIARQLGVNPSTVMRKLDKAARQLKSLYKEEVIASLRNLRGDNDRISRQTLGVIAAAWLLSSAQRATLAQTFTAEPAITSTTSIFTSTGGKIMSVAIPVALVVAIGLSFSNGKFSFQGPTEVGDISPSSISILKTEIRSLSDADISGVKEHRRRLSSTSLRNAAQSSVDETSRSAAVDATASSKLSATSGDAVKKRPPALGRISGQLTDESGNPLSDVTVLGSILTQAQSTIPPMTSGTRTVNMAQPVMQIIRKETDGQGRFELDLPTTGVGTLYVDHPPFARMMQNIVLPQEDIRLVLSQQNAGMIKGTIKNLATGEPVSYADVSIQFSSKLEVELGDQGETQSFRTVPAWERLKTDENGLYHVDRLPVCDLVVSGWADGVGPSLPQGARIGETTVNNIFPIAENEAKVLPDIILYPGYTMRGYVRDQTTKQPIEGTSVSYAVRRMTVSHEQVEKAATDSNGYYELKHLEPFIGNTDEGKESHLSFAPISAQKNGYKVESKMPRYKGKSFDINDLTVDQDFELRPGSSDLPPGSIMFRSR